ncbi:MAG: arylsulfatase [Candidatus Pedobacter colombiensis]|uniref:Arylsulfatase n=1 Tax=Candidatus Pedobacter colombiensis TaxID=3121371 RepID=A0AAJ6B4J0_9SPHI|nr:arylsulfatase [Pedobacter sp.]WEK17687.1 MAG: arylsulfatase [Pedobacter sp.]
MKYIKNLLLTAICLTTSISFAQQQTKPNIVYILTDDMGFGDISSLNKESKINTPNLDKMISNGIYFTDAHSNSSVCTPTRYGILTGRYAFRSSLKKGVLHGYSPALIEKGRPTVASFLRDNGYTTACIGKWHLGLGWAKNDQTKPVGNSGTGEKIDLDFNDNVNYEKVLEDGPLNHGFDYSYIIPASLDMSPYLYLRNNKAVIPATAYTPGKSESEGRGSMRRAGKMSPGFDFQQVLPEFINDAITYINKQSTSNKPFFLYLPLPSPHTPWVPTEEFKKSKAGVYGNYVEETDYMIGKVLEALKKNNLDGNTLVIVTSDNGSDWKPADIEKTNHHANYIFKGRKADIYDAGHRIPFIARWPTKIKPGSVSNEIMCTTDLFATVADIINKPLPINAAEDSEHMLPAFTGQQKSPIREAIVHHSLGGIFAIRKGDWKLSTELGSGGFTEPRKLEAKPGEAPMTLYNMASDIEEKNNLYFEKPEIVKELSTLLNKYITEGHSRKTN